MLQAIREGAQGWIAWVIVILISIPFAFWGINEYFGGGAEINVATVDDHEISQRDLQRVVQMRRQQLQEAFGNRALPEFIDDSMLKREALKQLIRETVVIQSAMDLGYRVSDQQAALAIGAFDAFQEGGRFSNRVYEQRLRMQGLTPEHFEAQMRRSMISRQMSAGITETAFVTSREVAEKERLENQERKIVYFTIPADSFRDLVSISDEEVRMHYQEHQDLFAQPESVAIEYIELKAADLGTDLEPSDEELHALYEERLQQFTTEEQRQASHILITVDPEADDSEIEAARLKADSALQRVRSGEAFADVARELSEDPGSAEQGGDLGFFGRGMMVPAFEKEVFGLSEGEISEPIRTAFGFHVIQLAGIRLGGTKSIDEVRSQLVKEYQAQAGEQRFFDLSEELANLAYEHPDSLAMAAEALELVIQDTAPFTRQGGSDLTANPKVVAAAFGEDVLVQGNNSEAIEVAPDHLVVLRVKEHYPESVQPLDEVKDQIGKELLDDEAQKRARERGEALAGELSDEEGFGKAAAEVDVELAAPEFLRRTGSNVNPAIIEEAFRLRVPDDGLAIGHAVLPNGDYVVIGLVAVRDPEPSDASPSDQQRLGLQRLIGQTELDGLLGGLESRAEVKINQSQL